MAIKRVTGIPDRILVIPHTRRLLLLSALGGDRQRHDNELQGSLCHAEVLMQRREDCGGGTKAKGRKKGGEDVQ